MNRKNFLKTGLIGAILGFFAPNYVNAIDKKSELSNTKSEPIRPIVCKIVQLLKNQPEKWKYEFGCLSDYLKLENEKIYINIHHSTFLNSSFTLHFKDSYLSTNCNEDRYIEPYFEKIAKPIRENLLEKQKIKEKNDLKNDIETILNY